MWGGEGVRLSSGIVAGSKRDVLVSILLSKNWSLIMVFP